MTARRYAYGDKVIAVIEGTVTGYDERTDEVDVEYPTELGTFETRLAVDSAAVQVHPADDVKTEYGIQSPSDSATVYQVSGESGRRVFAEGATKGWPQVTRLILPWSEVPA